EEERHRVDATHLRDLDDGKGLMLGIAEQAPGESAHQPAAYPFPRYPQHGSGGEGPARAQSRLEERDDHGDHADIEPAIGSERDDGQQGQGPRDGAVVLEREVEPAQEDDEEGGADEPAVSERGPGGAPEGGGE